MTWDEYLSDPTISQKSKDAQIRIMDGPDTPGQRHLLDKYGIKKNENIKSNLFHDKPIY